jgi:hypothetical protein
VEKCGNLGSVQGKAAGVLGACSACAGDYEDPDRTAWGDDDGDSDSDDGDDAEAIQEIAVTERKSSVDGTTIDEGCDFVGRVRRNDASKTSGKKCRFE